MGFRKTQRQTTRHFPDRACTQAVLKLRFPSDNIYIQALAINTLLYYF